MKKLLTLSMLLTIVVASYGQEKKARLMPSEAIALMYYRTDMNPDQSRDVNTKPIQPLVITEGLEGDELFYLGETYFWNLMPNESWAAFEKLKDQKTIAARAAWQRMFIININGFQNFEGTQKMLREYREQFESIAKDRNGAYFAVASLAFQYSKEGKAKEAVDLIVEELNYINYDGPFASYTTLTRFKKTFEEAGKATQWRQLTQKAHDGLLAQLEERKKNTPEKDIRYAVHSAPVDRMLTVMTEKLGYEQTNEKFQELIDQLAEALEK